MINQLQNPTMHVRFQGQSFDLPLRNLDLGHHSFDSDIYRILAKQLNVERKQLNGYVVERHANGNMTVRPEAIFG
ncbi:hypothetical protein KFU94_03480 [Chloroflexi bacterium TSY]|nr:hypothetical protein [Chloroflexi bacterium TSY]